MNDTSIEIQKLVRERMMAFSGEDRLRMGSDMYESCRQMAIASFDQGISKAAIRRAVFLRFYGSDFSPDEQRKIIQHLRKSNMDKETFD